MFCTWLCELEGLSPSVKVFFTGTKVELSYNESATDETILAQNWKPKYDFKVQTLIINNNNFDNNKGLQIQDFTCF